MRGCNWLGQNALAARESITVATALPCGIADCSTHCNSCEKFLIIVLFLFSAGLLLEVAKRSVSAARSDKLGRGSCRRRCGRYGEAERRGTSAKRWLREEVAKQRSNSSSVHPSIHSFVDSLVHWFVDALIRWFIDSLVHSFIDSTWFVGSLKHSSIDSDSLIRWSIGSSIHWSLQLLNPKSTASLCQLFNDSLGDRFVASWSRWFMKLLIQPPFGFKLKDRRLCASYEALRSSQANGDTKSVFKIL